MRKKNRTHIQTALLYSCKLHNDARYAISCSADAIHPLFWTLKDDLLTDCKKSNIKLRPWTVDEAEYMQKMIDMDVDAIITNYPDVVLALL